MIETVLHTSPAEAGNSQPPKAVRARGHRIGRGDAIAAWSMVAPALVLFTAFIVLPMIAVVVLSFFSWRFLNVPEFIGLDNFTRMISDEKAWESLVVTFKFLLFGVAPTVLLGFLLAILVNVNIRGIGILRVLYFVPVVLSVAVSAVVWGFMLDPGYGPIGAMFRSVGIAIPDALGSTTLVVPTLSAVMIWAALPIVLLLYLAALQRVSPDIYQAAELDGAGPWRIIWSISWPSVMSTTIVVAVLQIVGFSAGALDLALILTGGGPLGSSRALGLYIYEQAFISQDAGYAAALSLLQIVIIVALIAVGRWLSNKVNR